MLKLRTPFVLIKSLKLRGGGIREIWLVFPVLVSFFRIWLGELTSVYFISEAGSDDAAMVRYACLYNPFMFRNAQAGDMPFKELGFPFYQFIVEVSGLPYTIVLSLTWIVAALLTVRLFMYLTSNRIWLMFTYLTVLFTPIAFDASTGTRLYRNAIISPFVLMLFSLIFIILFELIKSERLRVGRFLLFYITLGLFLAFTCHIKEDGIWLLVCMMFAMLVYLVVIFVKWRNAKSENYSFRKLVCMIIMTCIPLFIYFSYTNMLKTVNYRLFGVYETNIRTEGELAEFVNNIYKVESKSRTTKVWAPTDAIEKVFNTSDTLKQYPQLREKIFNNSMYGNIYENPINGDMLTWVLRMSLEETGVWQSEKQVTELFAQVNDELEQAFENGILVKDDKFQLLSSTGGKSAQEIGEIFKAAFVEYKIHIILEGYRPGASQQAGKNDGMGQIASVLLNMDLMPLDGSAYQYRDMEVAIANKIISVLFRVYKVIQFILSLFTVVGLVWSIILCIKKLKGRIQFADFQKEIMLICSICVLLGISFVYAFGIAWFSSHMGNTVEVLKFYGVGMIPLLSLIELFGTFLFILTIKRNLNNKRKDE